MIFLPIYFGFPFIFVFQMTVSLIPGFRFYSFMWISCDWITSIGAKYQQNGYGDNLYSSDIFRIMLKYQLQLIFQAVKNKYIHSQIKFEPLILF